MKLRKSTIKRREEPWGPNAKHISHALIFQNSLIVENEELKRSNINYKDHLDQHLARHLHNAFQAQALDRIRRLHQMIYGLNLDGQQSAKLQRIDESFREVVELLKVEVED